MALGLYFASAFLIAWTTFDVGSIRVVSFFGVMFSIMYAVHKEERLNEEIKAMKRALKKINGTVEGVPCKGGEQTCVKD